LQEIVGIIAKKYPGKLKAILSLACGKSCIVSLEDESVIVRIRVSGIKVIPCTFDSMKKSSKTADVSVYMSRRAVSDLIDGKFTVLDGIENSTIEVFGDLFSLEVFYKVLEIVLSITPTSPQMVELFYKFKNEPH
jgi:hypothetical protein